MGIGTEKTFKLYKRLAAKGLAEAQHGLATMYYYGMGVEADYEKACKFYKLSAAQGYAEAQYALEKISEEATPSINK